MPIPGIKGDHSDGSTLTLPPLNPSFTPDDQPLDFKPVDEMFRVSNDCSIWGTFLVNGHYVTGTLKPPFEPVADDATLAVSGPEGHQRMQGFLEFATHRQGPTLVDTAEVLILAELTRVDPTNTITARDIWPRFLENRVDDTLADSSYRLFDLRRAFCLAWRNVTQWAVNA